MPFFIACSILLLSFTAYSKSFEVIAIEYPPYTSENEANNGLSFEALNQYFKQQAIHFSPLFLPPARAALYLKNDRWCLSFYPPLEQNKYPVIELDDYTIKLGLIRKTQLTPFSWQSLVELSGRKVAMLRSNEKRSDLITQFMNANITLINVESVSQGLQLLEKERVDYVFSDLDGGQYIMKQLGFHLSDYQFSQTLLLETNIKVWRNPNCHIPNHDAQTDQL